MIRGDNDITEIKEIIPQMENLVQAMNIHLQRIKKYVKIEDMESDITKLKRETLEYEDTLHILDSIINSLHGKKYEVDLFKSQERDTMNKIQCKLEECANDLDRKVADVYHIRQDFWQKKLDSTIYRLKIREEFVKKIINSPSWQDQSNRDVKKTNPSSSEEYSEEGELNPLTIIQPVADKERQYDEEEEEEDVKL
jgi:hypothetical protein